ncbi:MAG TPA: hypothetical protein VHY37_03935 [Tepidisphaeraceae bacterium]|nr:hypothetical protein [Tepidisphaeraceae bacterium]
MFVDDRAIPFQIAAPAAVRRLEWRVTDGWGAVVRRGQARLRGGKGRLTVAGLGRGWFGLQALDESGAAVSTCFTIVAPYDLVKIKQSPFGVMAHFAQGWDTDLIAQLARLGIKNVRDEIYWSSVEPRRGEFAFPASFEHYMKMLRQAHISPLTPLTFNNDLYDSAPPLKTWQVAPYTNTGFAGYARYASEVVKHYLQIRAVEVWNEYNGGFAQGPADGRPVVYRRMLKRAYVAVKKRRPGVTVLGCATVGVPLDWIEEVFQRGGIDHMDGISIHPYGFLSPPESVAAKLAALRRLIRKYNGGRDKPIWVTEQGYFTVAPGSCGNRDPITENTKACYLVRAWTLFLAGGVAKSFWYLARNDPNFGTMGLLAAPDDPRGRYAPLPAATAYAVLIRALTGRRFAQRDAAAPAGRAIDGENIHSYVFVGDARQLRIMWAMGGPADVSLSARGSLTVTDLFGVQRRVFPVAGRIHLCLGPAPLYVVGDANDLRGSATDVKVPAVAAAGESARIVARGPFEKPQPIDFTADGKDGQSWFPVEKRRQNRTVYFGIARIKVAPAPSIDSVIRATDANTLHVKIANASQQRSFRLSGVTWTVAGRERSEPLNLTVEAAGAATLKLAIAALPPLTIVPAAVTVKVDGNDDLTAQNDISFNPIPYRTIKVDGDLTAWAGVPAVELARCPWQNLLADRLDLSGTVRFAWDQEFFYVSADIADVIHDNTHHGCNTWKGDNIQLGISTLPPWSAGNWAAGWHELGLTLTDRGPELYRYSGLRGAGMLDQGRLVAQRRGGRTIYQAAISWAEISEEKAAPKTISVAFFVNNANGHGRMGYLHWGDIKQLNRMQPGTLLR